MSTMLGDWTVIFSFNGTPRRVTTPAHEPWSFEEILQGFWVTEDLRMCRMTQGVRFIPPSQIVLIERTINLQPDQ